MEIPSNEKKITDSVVIIGTGSVATIFIQHFLTIGINVIQHFGRKQPEKNTVPFTNDFTKINPNADLYIIAVNDDAIFDIANQLPQTNGIVVHTAGSVSIDDFANKHKNYGVLYPLQSFSKNRKIDLQSVPFIIEGNTKETEIKLFDFANTISNNVQILNYFNRLQIHLAAVFASNFSNHMNSVANILLAEKNIDFSILKPLLQETFDKILTSSPIDAQTGPAKRNDRKILEKHSEMLTNNPNFQEIYNVVSKSITDLHKK